MMEGVNSTNVIEKVQEWIINATQGINPEDVNKTVLFSELFGFVPNVQGSEFSHWMTCQHIYEQSHDVGVTMGEYIENGGGTSNSSNWWYTQDGNDLYRLVTGVALDSCAEYSYLYENFLYSTILPFLMQYIVIALVMFSVGFFCWCILSGAMLVKSIHDCIWRMSPLIYMSIAVAVSTIVGCVTADWYNGKMELVTQLYNLQKEL